MLTMTAIVVTILLTVTMWPVAAMGVVTVFAATFHPADPGEEMPVGVRVVGVLCGAAMATAATVVWYTFVFRAVPLLGVT